MPNTKSAAKRVKIEERNRLYNKHWKSRVKTAIKRVLEAAEKQDTNLVKEKFDLAQSIIDKAVSKGVIHKNTGARKKARLAAKIKSFLTA